jgi:hypothetical protein
MSRPILAIGDALWHGGREWTVAGIEGAMASGARIWLADKNGDGSLAVFALSELLRDPGFGPMAGPRLRVPQVGLLSTVPEDQQLRALDLERHVREVETGYPTPSGKGLVKPQYDPAVTTRWLSVSRRRPMNWPHRAGRA